MSNKKFIPVYGNVTDIRNLLSENNMDDKFSAMTPLQAMLSENGSHMRISDNDPESLSEDVCFIITSSETTNEEQEILVSKLNLVPAPISVLDPDDEESPLLELEEELYDEEKVINRFHRFQDVVTRIRYINSCTEDAYPILVRNEGKNISRMIRPDDEQVFFLVQLPTLIADSENSIPDVIADPESEAISTFTAVKVSYDGSEYVMDKEGDYLFISDPEALLFIESLTPSIVTTIAESDDDPTRISSWIINDSHIDGASPLVSKNMLECVGRKELEEFGIDLENVTYTWENDINVDPVSILSPLSVGKELMDSCGFLMSDDPDDDHDD